MTASHSRAKSLVNDQSSSSAPSSRLTTKSKLESIKSLESLESLVSRKNNKQNSAASSSSLKSVAKAQKVNTSQESPLGSNLEHSPKHNVTLSSLSSKGLNLNLGLEETANTSNTDHVFDKDLSISLNSQSLEQTSDGLLNKPTENKASLSALMQDGTEQGVAMQGEISLKTRLNAKQLESISETSSESVFDKTSYSKINHVSDILDASQLSKSKKQNLSQNLNQLQSQNSSLSLHDLRQNADALIEADVSLEHESNQSTQNSNQGLNTFSPNKAYQTEDGYVEPFAELETSNNAIYMPQPCSTVHKMTEDELKEEAAKDLAYERALKRAAVRSEIEENILRNNPALMKLLSTGDAARRILPAGHHPSIHPKKDLIENVKHGTSIFPFACYVWVPQNYSYRVALHWHPEVELVRFTRGTFKISIDMQDTVIEDNAFMLLPGNIMHTFTMPPNCEESAVVFDPHMVFLQNYDEVQSEILESLATGNMPLPPVITPEHPCFAKIDNLYSYCVENGATTNASRRLMIKAKLLEILSIYHEYGLISRKEVHTNIKRSKQDKLKELLNYIDSHYAGPITIKDASNRLGVTDQYFCRFFKRVTGMSFTEYLNDLRLRRAAKEIELTNRAISDIAYEHGFENVGYFFKSFKNKFSMTPLKYRKKHLASLPK